MCRAGQIPLKSSVEEIGQKSAEESSELENPQQPDENNDQTKENKKSDEENKNPDEKPPATNNTAISIPPPINNAVAPKQNANTQPDNITEPESNSHSGIETPPDNQSNQDNTSKHDTTPKVERVFKGDKPKAPIQSEQQIVPHQPEDQSLVPHHTNSASRENKITADARRKFRQIRDNKFQTVVKWKAYEKLANCNKPGESDAIRYK